MSLSARRHSSNPDPVADEPDVPAPAGQVDPEMRARIAELQRKLDSALKQIPPEDAAIVRLRFSEGLGLRDLQRALHLPELSEARITGILSRLRSLMSVNPTAGKAAT
jgi:DNA-directed RNA polymerase specialized sigma24 family protein